MVGWEWSWRAKDSIMHVDSRKAALATQHSPFDQWEIHTGEADHHCGTPRQGRRVAASEDGLSHRSEVQEDYRRMVSDGALIRW